MIVFHVDRFRSDILNLGAVYGGPPFWYEILREDTHPHNIWRALFCIGCLRVTGPEPAIRVKLHHPNSRVRAYACFALGQLSDEASVEPIHTLISDPSPRVRVHASFALRCLVERPPVVLADERDIAQKDERILISEDSAKAQDQIAAMLAPSERRLFCAASLEETLSLAKLVKPHLIITDNQKGKDNTSGLRMTTILSTIPELSETVIIMLTADSIESAFLWHGGDVHIRKGPHALGALAYHVQYYLRGGPITIVIRGPDDADNKN